MTRKRRRFSADFERRVALEALRERDTHSALGGRTPGEVYRGALGEAA